MSSTIERAAERLANTDAKPFDPLADPAVAPVNAHPVAPIPESSPEPLPESVDAEPVVNDFSNTVTDTVQSDSFPTPASDSADDLEDYVEIDLERLAELGFATPDNQGTAISRDIRRIKRRLMQNVKQLEATNPPNPPNLIMVTSALPGEGKTFISINLALSLAAEVDRRVLLVDGDLARGDVANILGSGIRLGLLGILDDVEVLARDRVLASNVERLEVLTSGVPRTYSDELWASAYTRDVFHDFANSDPERLVIVDGPPLIATTEAAVMSQIMGQVIMVVEADRTPQAAVTEALSHIDGHKNISVILNKTSGGRQGGYGGYGYGYGEAYGQEAKS